MAERKQYSLRSGNAEGLHVPIHIQSAGDTEFLSMLQNQQASTDDSSDSISEGEQNEEVVVGQPGTEQTVSKMYVDCYKYQTQLHSMILGGVGLLGLSRMGSHWPKS